MLCRAAVSGAGQSIPTKGNCLVTVGCVIYNAPFVLGKRGNRVGNGPGRPLDGFPVSPRKLPTLRSQVQPPISQLCYVVSIPKKPLPEESPNRHVVPGRRFWRRSDSSGRRAGLNLIATLWGEGSPSPDGPEQVSNGGPVQHGG